MNQNSIRKSTSAVRTSNAERNSRDMLAVQLRKSGCTLQQIADSIGTTSRTASRILSENSVRKPKKPSVKALTRSEKSAALSERMMELRNQGYENGEIAEMLGVCYQTVHRYIGKQPAEMFKIRMKCYWETKRIEDEHRAQKAAAAQNAAKNQEKKVRSVVNLCKEKLNPFEYNLLVKEINKPTAA